ncbi:hypothetical protein PFISCL1PPCAC_5703, partial [Pristionchus fissidentatus]
MNVPLLLIGDEYLQYLRASTARLDGVPVSLSARDVASVGSSVVKTGHLLARSLVGAFALVSVDVSLDTSSRAVVVIGASLPRSVKGVSGLQSNLSAVLVVGRLDLVVSTGQRSHIHHTSDGFASGFLVANALEAVGGERGADESGQYDEDL